MPISKGQNRPYISEENIEEDSSLCLLGWRIRRLRKARGITLAELSTRAQVSVAMLSHIERSQTTPSLKTLDRIRVALQVPLSSFFRDDELERDPERRVVVRVEDRLKLSFDGLGLIKELLSPEQGTNLEVFVLVIEPGGGSGQQPWSREGEKAGLVLSGRFELVIGEEHWLVNTNDSFQFDSSLPHWFRNASDEEARVLWIIKSDSPA